MAASQNLFLRLARGVKRRFFPPDDRHDGKRLPRISSLIEIPSLSAPYKLVSLDIFDTVLCRTTEPPEYVKSRSNRFFSLLLASKGVSLSESEIKNARKSAESEVRGEAQARGFDHEVNLIEILSRTVSHIAPDNSELVESWQRYEVAAEVEHLRAKPGAIEMLTKLRSAGKRIVLTSDMYLERGHLEEILSSAGVLPLVDDIFVSCEYRLGKYSGRLFQAVLKKTGFAANEAIHFGDNRVSDVIAPLKLGIGAYWLKEDAELKQRKVSEERFGRADWSLHRSLSDSGSKVDGDAVLARIGSEIVGPSFALFTLHVLDEVIRRGVRDVYFVAREGKTFMDAAELFATQILRYRHLEIPRFHYLYASRMSTTLAGVHRFDSAAIDVALHRKEISNAADVLVTFGLTEENLGPLPWAEFGLKPETSIDSEASREALVKMLSSSSVGPVLEGLAETCRASLKEYLMAEEFFSPGLKAIVDMGWNGTIQVNLFKAFGGDPDYPEVVGLYYGRHRPRIYEAFLGHVQIEQGFALDSSREASEQVPLSTIAPLFEIAATPGHGTTIGYADGKPILCPVEGFQSTPAFQTLTESTRRFLSDFPSHYNRFEMDLEWLKSEVQANLLRLAKNPTILEARAIAKVHQDINWGGTETVNLVDPSVTPMSIFRLSQARQKVHNSAWPRGTQVLLGPFATLYEPLVRMRANLNRMLRRGRG